MKDDALFRVIEGVLKERGDAGTYTARDKVNDVMSAVEKQEPGTSMSVGDITKILIRVKAMMSRMTISRCIRELCDEGRIVFVGKELRPGTARKQLVPVYQVVKGA